MQWPGAGGGYAGSRSPPRRTGSSFKQPMRHPAGLPASRRGSRQGSRQDSDQDSHQDWRQAMRHRPYSLRPRAGRRPPAFALRASARQVNAPFGERSAGKRGMLAIASLDGLARAARRACEARRFRLHGSAPPGAPSAASFRRTGRASEGARGLASSASSWRRVLLPASGAPSPPERAGCVIPTPAGAASRPALMTPHENAPSGWDGEEYNLIQGKESIARHDPSSANGAGGYCS